MFAFRPEYNDCWEYRIWLETDAAVAMARGIARDTPREGPGEARRLHRHRYHAAGEIYLTEVRPRPLADIVIDNEDFTRPRLLRST